MRDIPQPYHDTLLDLQKLVILIIEKSHQLDKGVHKENLLKLRDKYNVDILTPISHLLLACYNYKNVSIDFFKIQIEENDK